MNESVSSLIKLLGDAVDAELANYEGRALAAEARENALRKGLQSLLDGLTSGPAARDELAIETDAPPTPILQRRSKCPDAVLVGALTEEWTSAAALKRTIAAGHGIAVADGTIYNRMRKLVRESPDVVEATTKPERWRLRQQPPADDDFPDTAIAATSVRASKRSRPDVRPRPFSTLNENDNDSVDVIHPPHLVMGDCLDVMKQIPDESVDLILADLPYAVTGLDIDTMIPPEVLFQHFRRIIKKPHGNIVLFGQQPFTTALVNAAPDLFKYSMTWNKNRPSHFQHSTARPLGVSEDLLVFSFGSVISGLRSARSATFHPQGAVAVKRVAQRLKRNNTIGRTISGRAGGETFTGLSNCPTTILTFPLDPLKRGEEARLFAKPVDLLAYLIRSYSNAGETVLDCTMGTGSTIIAAMRTGRRAIGIELDEKRFNQAMARIENEMRTMAGDIGKVVG